MKKILVVVDMQNDFIDGALGTNEAVAIVPAVEKKIAEWDGDIVCTLDTHSDDYLATSEGQKLPVVHCVKDSDGWQINDRVCVAVKTTRKNVKVFTKGTFGSVELAEYIKEQDYDYIEFIGLCTDICVISNVLVTKAMVPEATIVVDAACCAGVTPNSHYIALNAMKSCQIEIVNERTSYIQVECRDINGEIYTIEFSDKSQIFDSGDINLDELEVLSVVSGGVCLYSGLCNDEPCTFEDIAGFFA